MIDRAEKMADFNVENARKPAKDDLTIISDALREQFGDDAKTVARIQFEKAEPNTRDAWEAILAHLS